MKYRCAFIVRNANKLLLLSDHQNGQVCFTLPAITYQGSMSDNNGFIMKFKEKYNIEIVIIKKLLQDNGTVWFEACIPHKIQQEFSWNTKWVTLITAQKYPLSKIDTKVFTEYLQNNIADRDIKLQFGIKDGKILHISEIKESERGNACTCQCPQCGMQLQAKLGHGKRKPHFAHNNETCNIQAAQQTALHLLAKEILQENHHIILPQYALEGYLGGNLEDTNDYEILDRQHDSFIYMDSVDFHFDSVILEKRMDDIVPDIVIHRNGTDRCLIVEIAVTHFVDDIKRAKIEHMNVSTMEIDISQLLDQQFDRKLLQKIIIDSVESKTWIYNVNYNRAIKMLEQRNKELGEEDNRRQEVKEKKRLEEMQKANAKIERGKSILKSVQNALKPLNYSEIVKGLRNDSLVEQYKNQVHLFTQFNSSFPFFLDIPITGEIAFNCDRRIWQMTIFDQFIYYRKENSCICLAKIWKWLTSYQKDQLLNWNLITKSCLLVGNKYYNSNLALEAVHQYLIYLSDLGFIQNRVDMRYSEEYPIVCKEINPPNEKIAGYFQIVIDSLSEIYPEIDSVIEEQLKTLITFG